MPDRSSIFDMIGPVMIGPSSSHTAGVVRIARGARRILGSQPQKVIVTFYNSFATTFEGHGSDRAVIAGLFDFKTDDERIKNSLDIAKQNGLDYVFRSIPSASVLHPNSIRIKMETGERKAEVLGISRGGGLISIVEIDGFNCNFTAQLHTVIIRAEDVRGSIAFISNLLSNDNCNIATMSVSREAKNKKAKLVIEVDSAPRPITLEYMGQLSWINDITYIPDIDL